MKKLVQVQDVDGQGMEALLGQRVTFYCLNYIYCGELIGVNTTDVILKDALLVYDTGDYKTPKFADAQPMAGEWRLRTAAIESYGVLPNK